MEDINKNMDWAEVAVRLYFSGKGIKEAILEAIKMKDIEEIKNNE